MITEILLFGHLIIYVLVLYYTVFDYYSAKPQTSLK